MVKSVISATSTLALILAIGAIFSFPRSSPAEEGQPVEIGSSCGEIEATYHLTSDIQKSLWQLNELYAVPVGTYNPESWEQSSSFNSAFIAALQGQEDATAYAEACGTVWQNFFSEDADVLVTLRRTITTTDQILQCISGNWAFSSIQYLEDEDVSDWLTVNGSPFDVMNESSLSLLQMNLESLVNDLNAQPGSESEP